MHASTLREVELALGSVAAPEDDRHPTVSDGHQHHVVQGDGSPHDLGKAVGLAEGAEGFEPCAEPLGELQVEPNSALLFRGAGRPRHRRSPQHVAPLHDHLWQRCDVEPVSLVRLEVVEGQRVHRVNFDQPARRNPEASIVAELT